MRKVGGGNTISAGRHDKTASRKNGQASMMESNHGDVLTSDASSSAAASASASSSGSSAIVSSTGAGAAAGSTGPTYRTRDISDCKVAMGNAPWTRVSCSRRATQVSCCRHEMLAWRTQREMPA